MTWGRKSQIEAIETHWERLWNTYIFSHRNTRSQLDSLMQAIIPLWIHKMNPKWLDNLWFTQHLGRYTKPVSKISPSSFFSSPTSCCLSLPPFPLVWPGCYFFWLMFLCLRSLILWLCGPADRSYTVPAAICLPSGPRPCVYLFSCGSLVSLVSGVVSLLWCLWTRFVHLAFVTLSFDEPVLTSTSLTGCW
jgi:hypothetical protein